jgi:hypothetical protein
MARDLHKLIIELLLRDKASKGVSQFELRLRTLDSQGKKTLRTLKLVDQAMGKSGRVNIPRSAGGTAQTQEVKLLQQAARLRQEQARLVGIEARNKAQAAQVGIRAQREELRLQQQKARLTQANLRGSSSTELAETRLLRERVKLRREEQRLVRSSRGSRVDQFNTGVRTARNVASVARQTYDAIKSVADPALDQLRARERFRIMGFSEQENQRGFAAVGQTTKQIRGVRQVDVQETLTGLVNTLGGVDEAIKFLPIATKYRANMQALYGDKYGPAEVTKQIADTFKALETLGVDRPTGAPDATGQRSFTSQDQARMEQYFNLVARATAASGGDIDPGQFRAFTKYSRLAGQGLSPEGMTKLMPLIQSLGGAQTGTAMMALYSNMVGGTIPAYKLRNWQDLGLLDQSKVEFSKGNKHAMSRLKPGAIPIAEGLGQDPMAVADKLTDAFRKKGIDVDSGDAVNKQLISMFGNIRGVGALSQMINFRAGMSKEARNYERSLAVNQTYDQVFGPGSPLGQLLNFRATKENAFAQAGQPVVEIGGTIAEQLTGYIKSAQASAGDNPAYAAAMVGVLSLGKASAEAADGVGLFNGMLRVGNGGGGGSGVDAGDALIGGGWAAKRFGKGALGLGLGLAKHPATLPVLGAIAGAGSLYNLFGADAQNTKDIADISKGNRGAYDALIASGRAYNATPDEYSTVARSVLSGFNKDQALEVALNPGKFPFYRGTVGPDRPYGSQFPFAKWAQFQPEKAGSMFRDMAPQLQIPGVMRSAIQDVRRNDLGLPDEGVNQLLEALRNVNPGVYKQSVSPGMGSGVEWVDKIFSIGKGAQTQQQPLAPQLDALVRPTADVTAGFTSLNKPLGTLPSDLASLSSSLQTATDQISSLNIALPAFGGGGVASPAAKYLGFGGGRARGGRVIKGVDYIGGERGVELFTPNRDGYVTPHHKLVSLLDANARDGGSFQAHGWRDEAQRAAPIRTTLAEVASARQGGGRRVTIERLEVNVTGGSRNDAQKIAEQVAREIEQRLREVERKTEPEHIYRTMSRRHEREDELS